MTAEPREPLTPGQTIAFLRSVIRSGERLSPEDDERINATLIAMGDIANVARAVLQPEPREPLTAALEELRGLGYRITRDNGPHSAAIDRPRHDPVKDRGSGIGEEDDQRRTRQGHRPEASMRPVAEPREPLTGCTVKVWDGPFQMECGRAIVNGECDRHGKVANPEPREPLTAVLSREEEKGIRAIAAKHPGSWPFWLELDRLFATLDEARALATPPRSDEPWDRPKDPARRFAYWFVSQPYHRQLDFIRHWLSEHPDASTGDSR